MHFEFKICLITFFTIILFSVYVQGHATSQRNCGVLYSNISNTQFPIAEGSSHENLETFHEKIINESVTVQISEGCSLKVCNESYFKGLCNNVTNKNTQESLPFQIHSASCSCSPNTLIVSCNDKFRFRKNKCALAFVNSEGCDSLNRVYTEIEIGDTKIFPEKFERKVSSVIVHPGCKLLVFSEHDFEDDDDFQELFNVTKKIKLPIRSTQCSCEANRTSISSEQKSESNNDPLSLTIPQNFEHLRQLWDAGNSTIKSHPGLLSAMKSSRAKRSPRNAYILLLGSTGAGKSSTINFLFDTQVTSVGGTTSTTNQIHEFRIPIPIPALGINNSELRVIDTPGLGDTGGLQNDATFLATLEQYLDQHEELKDRIPNVVLIFHSFHDNRFYGGQSAFVQMLRSLDSLRSRFTDSHYSNVIFVFTHFMSGTRAEIRDPKLKLQKFTQTIREFSGFPRPISIVVAENKPYATDLLSENGYYKLPNGEYYPRNLLDALSDATSRGEDPIGSAIIRSAFRDPDSFNISRIDFNMTEMSHPRVLRHFAILSERLFHTGNGTELLQKLSEAFEKMPKELKEQFPSSLPDFKSSLEQLSIKTVDQMETLKEDEIIELLFKLKQNNATNFLLKEAFNISAPKFPHDLVVGYGYDIFKDKYIDTSPLIVFGEYSSSAGMGYLIPPNLGCLEVMQTTEVMSVFEDKASYIKQLLNSLEIFGVNSAEDFQISPHRPGWNIKENMESLNSNGSKVLTLSSVRWIRIYELYLPTGYAKFLSSQFRSAVNVLTPFNSSSEESVEMWKTFFSTYGTHLVKSVYIGGSIESKLEFSEKANKEDVESAGFKWLDDITLGIERNRSLGINSSFIFKGGQEFFVKDSADFTEMRISDASNRLKKWKDSIKFNPIVLRDGIKLVPLSVVVNSIRRNIAVEVHKAMSLLFNSELKYIPPKKTPPKPRNEIDILINHIKPEETSMWGRIWQFFKNLFG